VRAGAGDSNGGLNLAGEGWEGAAHGEGRSSAAGIAAGGSGWGTGVGRRCFRVRGYVRGLLGSLNSLPD
jgi:hypothetical protein